METIDSKYSAALAGKRPEEMKLALSRRRTELQDCVRRALQLAREHPRDPVAFEALEWVVTGLQYFDETLGVQLETLRRDYVTDKRMSLVCARARMYRIFYGPTEDLLRAVREQNPDRRVRAVATITLAGVLRDYVRLVRYAKDPSTVAGSWQNDYPKGLVQKVENWEPEQMPPERGR